MAIYIQREVHVKGVRVEYNHLAADGHRVDVYKFNQDGQAE